MQNVIQSELFVHYNRLLCTILAQSHVIIWQNSTFSAHQDASNDCHDVKFSAPRTINRVLCIFRGDYENNGDEISANNIAPSFDTTYWARRNKL